MPFQKLPKLKTVYNGRTMVQRVVQDGGKVSVPMSAAMDPIQQQPVTSKVPEVDDKQKKFKLMQEIYRRL